MAPSVPPLAPGRHRPDPTFPDRRRRPVGVVGLVVALAAVAAGCTVGSGDRAPLAVSAPATTVAPATTTATGPLRATTDAAATADGTRGATGAAGGGSSGGATTTVAPVDRGPEWLGRRVLATSPDGVVEVPQTTPTELRARRFTATDLLPPPADGRFASSIEPVDDDVLARSTWRPGCPVEPNDLAHVTVSFWGFDDRPHTGELLINTDVAADIVGVFAKLYAARFPIEEMRIVTTAELDAPPTGDGNNTTAFVCRPVVGGTRFSEHASGLAVDINPFHNPYQRGDLVLPELAGHYLDRSLGQAGMIDRPSVVIDAFEAIGWRWGGDWRSLVDYHHFSHNGR